MARRKQAVDSRRRLPRQARARNKVDVILEAAARILQSEGKAALTTNHIAERAGVGISTLYQYFANKEAILIALARREMEIHEGYVVDAIAKQSDAHGAERDRQAVRALIDASGRRHRMRRLAIDALATEGFVDDFHAPMPKISAAVAAHAQSLLPGFEGTLSPVALFVLTRAIHGVVGAAMREGSPQFRGAELEDELVRLIRGYVGARPSVE